MGREYSERKTVSQIALFRNRSRYVIGNFASLPAGLLTPPLRDCNETKERTTPSELSVETEEFALSGLVPSTDNYNCLACGRPVTPL